MNSTSTTVGIDRRKEQMYLARVRHTETGHWVTDLVKVPASALARCGLLSEQEIVLAVPDHEVRVKRFRLEQPLRRWDPDDVVRFELALTLLDTPEPYSYDQTAASPYGRSVAVVGRREKLLQVSESYLSPALAAAKNIGYQMRALALGKGFLKFCAHQDQDLVCLIDFGTEGASIVLIQNHAIVDVAYLSTARLDCRVPDWLRLLAGELRTVVDFRIASLPESAVRDVTPAFLISGDCQLREALQAQLPYHVDAPRLDSHRLASGLAEESVQLGDFVVALGLTIK